MARDMLHYSARATLNCVGPQSGTISNEFHFLWVGTGTPATADWNQLATDTAGFYVTTITATSHSVGSYLSPSINRVSNTHEVSIYALDMADPHHYYGSPVTVGSFSMPVASSSLGLPQEIALVGSYRADYGTDPEHGGATRPRADDRGRVYVGPLCDAANTGVTIAGMKLSVPDPIFINTLSGALSLLATTAFAHHWQMCVWSRKRSQFKEAISKAVNNDWDVQRRRGLATTLQNWVPM